MSVPLVSVVIPTFNRGYCIERTIKSVIQQTFSDWEIIVVDNYSSDETDELLKNFIGNKIKLLKINNNGIVGKSRNLGISVAQGKYVDGIFQSTEILAKHDENYMPPDLSIVSK